MRSLTLATYALLLSAWPAAGIIAAPPATQAPSAAKLDRPLFVNPIAEGAAPWTIRHGDHHYFCQSEGNDGIAVFKSPKLTDKGVKRVVWRTQPGTWNSSQVWAPELHRVNDRWYIYYCASNGRNANHRAGVLAAVTDDPQGEYEDKGLFYTGDDLAGQTDNRWSIDATPLQLGDRLYLIWSGWPTTEDIQYLYIAPMHNPWTVSGNRVKLCENDTYVWERVSESLSERGLNEGPQILKRHGRVFIIYSCSGSWEPTYKLAMLYMDENADPLDPASWTKHDRPVFQSTDEVFGVGHASFTVSPDGTEEWIVYHAKRSREPGWQRAVYLQRFGWTSNGFPDFGQPSPAGQALPAPSGEQPNQPGHTFRESFADGTWDRWVYFGHNRYLRVIDGELHLGRAPGPGAVNLYRCGEKALVRGFEWEDFSLRVRVRVTAGQRDAGALFRVQQPALGYDAQKGYFAGIIPATNKVILGRTYGTSWHELASADHPNQVGQWYDLRIEARGDRIQILLDGRPQITHRDSHYPRGMAGLRVVDIHAQFDDFDITPHPAPATQ
jgi:GH43 family beta-xylosidase